MSIGHASSSKNVKPGGQIYQRQVQAVVKRKQSRYEVSVVLFSLILYFYKEKSDRLLLQLDARALFGQKHCQICFFVISD